MGDILVGTASWTDKTLIASGWYPDSAKTPAKRLVLLVPVSARRGGLDLLLPAERSQIRFAVGEPNAQRLYVQHQSILLLTGHPTKVASLYKDLHARRRRSSNVYPTDLDRTIRMWCGTGFSRPWNRW